MRRPHTPVAVQRFSLGETPTDWEIDELAVEEPLEIRVQGQPVAVTMRTPGHDLDLAVGFLRTEGVVDDWDDIHAIAHVDDPQSPRGNTVDCVLAPGVPAARARSADRALFASSSCGICGKATVERVFQHFTPRTVRVPVVAAHLFALPDLLRTAQEAFARTGGLHAAALVDRDGKLCVVREDVGRHNAVDKVIGAALRADINLSEMALFVSSRAGFELVQKACVAGIPLLAAMGAPTSLAAELAHQGGLQLVGFLRDGRFNVYGAPADGAPHGR